MRRETQITFLLLVLAALFGAYVRLFAVASAGFPLLDGGLFYTMTQDLVANHFHLPSTTSYNHLNIPFAYPPLPFYLAGFIQIHTHLDLLVIIQWLPTFFSLLTIPFFFLLARELLGTPAQGALATLLFALLPRSYDWIIMGGGLTRAPAALALILMAWCCYRAFHGKSWKAAALTSVFGGLVLLSHPERALHAAATGLLFWLWLDRSKSGTLRALTIGAGTLLVSAPWWVTVLIRHGTQPFLLAAQAGGARWLFWAPLLQLNFTDETVPLIALLAVLGAFVGWRQGKGLLAAWLLLAFLIDPRSAPHVVAVQVSLLATIALAEVLFPALERFSSGWLNVFEQTSGRVMFGYIFVVMTLNAQMNMLQIDSYVLTNADRKAIDWITSATPSESRFLLVDGQEKPMFSPLLEWFPALSERTSVTTIQGREWLPGLAHFKARIETYPDLVVCLYEDTICLSNWATQNGETYDYVYLSLELRAGERRRSRLSDSLLTSSDYSLVYETPEVLILKRLP